MKKLILFSLVALSTAASAELLICSTYQTSRKGSCQPVLGRHFEPTGEKECDDHDSWGVTMTPPGQWSPPVGDYDTKAEAQEVIKRLREEGYCI